MSPTATDGGASRRAFLRGGLRRVLDVVDDLVPLQAADAGGGPTPLDEGAQGTGRVLPQAASAARRLATVEDVLELADHEGLEGRLDEVRRHVRTSFRLTEAARDAGAHQRGGSWLWGTPPRRPGPEAWPARAGVPLLGLCHLDLAALAGRAPLPATGGLTVFFSPRAAQGPEPGPVDCGRGHVELRRDPTLGRAFAASVTARPATLTPERSLPRVWAAAVQELDLDPAEGEAWGRLRSRLAALQGVTLFDEVDAPLALHRLLGHADERAGLAPEPDAEGAWELLVQVTLLGSPLSARWLVERTRLYVWIRSASLARADFRDVRVIAH